MTRRIPGLMRRGGRSRQSTAPALSLADSDYLFDARFLVTESGGRVSEWVDVIAAVSATQATPGNQPLFTLEDAAFNNMPTVQSDSNARFMLSGSLVLGDQWSVFEYGAFTSAGGSYAHALYNGTLGHIAGAMERSGANQQWYSSDGTTISTPVIADAAGKRAICRSASGTSGTWYRNAGGATTTSTGTIKGVTTEGLQLWYGSGLSQISTLACLAIFARPITQVEFEALAAECRGIWG